MMSHLSLRTLLLVSIIGLLLALAAAPARALPTLTNVQLDFVTNIGGTVTEITHLDDERLVLVSQDGPIYLFAAGALQPTPLLDLAAKISTGGSEQGLLGLAVHPDFASNGHFFVNYTDLNGDTQVERYTISTGDPDIADPNSDKPILFVDQPFQNHNSGVMRFGPDGYLYISLGDGGSGGDPQNNAQNPNVLLGKILRIDIDTDAPYAIPTDNPFVGGGGLPEIWLLGVRNPWRMAFDGATGNLWLADVGQHSYEEINVLTPADGGANLGWDCREGTAVYPVNPDDPDDASPLCSGLEPEDFTAPVHAYFHSESPRRCSVAGGQVYRGTRFPEMEGLYFFADLCSREMWTLGQGPDYTLTPLTLNLALPSQPTAFGSAANGDLYLGLNNGNVYRVQPEPPLAVALHGQPVVGGAPGVMMTLFLLMMVLGVSGWSARRLALTASPSPGERGEEENG